MIDVKEEKMSKPRKWLKVGPIGPTGNNVEIWVRFDRFIVTQTTVIPPTSTGLTS